MQGPVELSLKGVHLLWMKTVEDVDFTLPHIPASRIRALAEGGRPESSKPVLLVGGPSAAKTRYSTGQAIAARPARGVRFTTSAASFDVVSISFPRCKGGKDATEKGYGSAQTQPLLNTGPPEKLRHALEVVKTGIAKACGEFIRSGR